MHLIATFETRTNRMAEEYHIPILIFNSRKFELNRRGCASRTSAQIEADGALRLIERAVERMVRSRTGSHEVRTAKPRSEKPPVVTIRQPAHPPTLESL